MFTVSTLPSVDEPPDPCPPYIPLEQSTYKAMNTLLQHGKWQRALRLVPNWATIGDCEQEKWACHSCLANPQPSGRHVKTCESTKSRIAPPRLVMDAMPQMQVATDASLP